ncbi:hypothetical protein KWI12_08535 [Citrobacter cronae]|uniref:hypothetical protein n=1 Tax=Citrobacter cronae TaxID=1748967 RepID=UPI0021D2F330|nr:hypothetical protein [Citrobacter cronae]MCU6196895.1 hypothetical protein [Citrobacter cronae]
MRLRTVVLISISTLVISACDKPSSPLDEKSSPPPQSQQPSKSGVDTSTVKRAIDGNDVLKKYGFVSSLPPGFQITPASVRVSENLAFRAQVEQHAVILDNLRKALDDSQARKKFAAEHKQAPDMFDQYLSAQEDETNTLRYLAPYAIAQGKANVLKNEGFKLKKVGGKGDWKGDACNGAGKCSEVDPTVALMMMLIGSVTDEFNKEHPFGEENELTKVFFAVVKFVDRPLGDNSDLVSIREAMLAHDQNGEIAKLIRDPVKRPIEVVQEVRDKIIDPDDQGEVAKALRDPLKCTVGHLFGSC